MATRILQDRLGNVSFRSALRRNTPRWLNNCPILHFANAAWRGGWSMTICCGRFSAHSSISSHCEFSCLPGFGPMSSGAWHCPLISANASPRCLKHAAMTSPNLPDWPHHELTAAPGVLDPDFLSPWGRECHLFFDCVQRNTMAKFMCCGETPSSNIEGGMVVLTRVTDVHFSSCMSPSHKRR